MFCNWIAQWKFIFVAFLSFVIAVPTAICNGAWSFDVPTATDTISNSASGFLCAGVGESPDTTLIVYIYNAGQKRGEGGGALIGTGQERDKPTHLRVLQVVLVASVTRAHRPPNS